MNKDRQPDWQDTNMANFGSDIEKNIKAAAADGEPQWDGAGIKVGIQIWRIEQFKVKPWPKNKNGQFHKGDSYIILNTYVKDPKVNKDKLAWDIHFWIGSESTQDEYGTAAYKTVELDDKLGGEPVQHRETEGGETDLFKSYFRGGIKLLEGGVDTGFKKASDRVVVHDPTMYQVKGASSSNLVLRQVKMSRSAMNSGDVFILDTSDIIFQWNGGGSNAHEKNQGKTVCQAIRTTRGGKPQVQTLDEGSDGIASNDGMWTYLPADYRVMFGMLKLWDYKIQSADYGGKDEDVQPFPWTLYKVKENGAYSTVTRGTRKKPSVSKLKSDGVYIFDSGFEVFLWVGNKAPSSLKGSAYPRASQYIRAYKRPPVLPILHVKEGKESTAFQAFLGPKLERWCCGAFEPW